MEISLIAPVYVYTQATTPTDLTEGKIWVDTSTDPPVTKVSDGTTYNALTQDTTNINKLIGLNALNIIDLTAQATLTAGTNANFIRDVFTDADGYLDTIDTGNTTANFDTDHYQNSGEESLVPTLTAYNLPAPNLVEYSAQYSDNEGAWRMFDGSDGTAWSVSTGTQWASIDLGEGNEITGEKCRIVTTNNPSKYPTDYKIQGSNNNSDWTDLATRTGRGSEDDTFDLTNSTAYRYYRIYVTAWSSTGFHYVGTLEIIGQATHDKLLQTDEQTIDAGFEKFMIISNETTAGTGNITYDISFDSGSNYQEGVSSFTEYDISDAGTGVILKANLDGEGSGNTAQITNWGVLLW